MILPLIGAGISAVSGLIAGKQNLKSTRETNAANLQIAREQNQFNLEQWKREVSYNDSRWNIQNDYNTPEAQRQRFEAAGINPFMALSNIQSGNAEALSAPRGTPAAGATMQPSDYSYIHQTAMDTVSSYYNLKMQETQIQGLEEENRGKAIDNAYRSAMNAANLKKLGLDSDAVKLQNDFSKETYSDRVATTKIDKDNSSANYFLTMEKTELAKTENEINKWSLAVERPKQLALAVAQTSSILKLQASQTALNKKELSVMAANILKLQAETLGVELNNEVLDRSVDYLVTNNMVKEMDSGVYGSGVSAKNATIGVSNVKTRHKSRINR